MVKKLLTKTRSALRKVHYKRQANFYFACTGLLLIGLIYYATTNYFELTDKKTIINESTHAMRGLTESLDDVAGEYESLKETHNLIKETVSKEVGDVFPAMENYTELTRDLDEYFKTKSQTDNPLVATNLQYGSPKVSEDGNYYVLPLSMTISSSEENFYDFLSYVDKSGALSSKTRIMDITSIKINFRDPTGKQKKGGEEINFNVQLNAYYQKLD
jgi:hypothetical protein